MKKLYFILAMLVVASVAFADNYSEEPTKDTTINIVGTYIYHMDIPAYNYQLLDVYQDDDKQMFFASIVFNPFENGSAEGTYTLATDDQHVGAGQFAPSSGVHDASIWPSYVARFIGGSWDTDHVYFIMGGTMTITYPEEGTMTVSAQFTTYNGSTINVSYTGDAEDMPTAVDDVAMSDEVYAANGVLNYSGDGSYSVYTMGGVQVYEGIESTIELPSGVYVVRTSNRTYKVVL